MVFWKRVPDERRSVGDRQHHCRTVDRDIPCQVAPLQSLTPFLPALSVERLLFVATNKHRTWNHTLKTSRPTLQSDEPEKKGPERTDEIRRNVADEMKSRLNIALPTINPDGPDVLAGGAGVKIVRPSERSLRP